MWIATKCLRVDLSVDEALESIFRCVIEQITVETRDLSGDDIEFFSLESIFEVFSLSFFDRRFTDFLE